MTGFLEGRLALVTGASRGIGAATAEALAGEGAHVVLVARTATDLEEVEERIHAAGGSATIAPVDLAEPDGIAKLATAIGGRWDSLDILVLNAAMLGTLTPVAQIDGKEFNRLLTLNLLAQQALIAGFDPLLRRSESGRLIAVTSSVGRNPRAYWGAYGEEVAKVTPIRAAIVDPGATATQMRARAFPGEDPATLKPPSAVANAIVDLLRQDFETGYRLKVS